MSWRTVNNQHEKQFYASLQTSAGEASNAHAHDEKHEHFLGVSFVHLI